MDNSQFLTTEEDERNKQIVRDADEIRITTQTQGWKTVIQPLIDKMITDSMGCKSDNMWSEGALADCEKVGIEVEKMIWYRKALIEFNNTIHQYAIEANKIKQSLVEKKAKESQEEQQEFLPPMMDTTYADSPEAPIFADKYSGGLTSG